MKRSQLGLGLTLCGILILSACGQLSPARQRAASLPTVVTSPSQVPTASDRTGPASTARTTGSLQPREYEGVPLPSPDSISNPDLDVRLPAAWLLIGGEATAGIHGSYTYETGLRYPCTGNTQETPSPGERCNRMTHADVAPPDDTTNPNVASVHASTATRPVIVVESRSIRKIETVLRDWHEGGVPASDPSWREVRPIEVEHDSSVTTYTFGPLGRTGDHILTVTLSFEGNNEITYYWRVLAKDMTR